MFRLQLDGKFALLAVVAISFAGVSCREQDAQHRVAPEPRASATASRQAPFDVEAVIRQVHLAYRQEEDARHGGHSTYDVRATAQGLTLTPVPSQRSEPSEVKPGASLFLG